MSANNETTIQNFDVDQDEDDDTPLMVIHFRKATSALSLDNIGNQREPLANAGDVGVTKTIPSNWANDPKVSSRVDHGTRNDTSSPAKSGKYTAAPFRSVESPFKMVLSKEEKKFSATPGPGAFKGPASGFSGFGEASTYNAGTPTRSTGGNNPETPLQYNMFKSDDGWSNVRKVAGGLGLDSPSQHSMSPLMNSMVDRVVDHNSPLPPRLGAKGSSYGNGKPTQERAAEMAAATTAAVDADLDICNVAKTLAANPFQGSMGGAGTAGGADYSYDFKPQQRQAGSGQYSAEPPQPAAFNRTLFGSDDYDYSLHQDSAHYWQANDTSDLGNSALLIGEQSHFSSGNGSFASRSFPQFSTERVTGQDSILSGTSSMHPTGDAEYHPNTSGVNHNDHNDSAFSSSGYSVQHSYPAYHRPVGSSGGILPLQEPQYGGIRGEYAEPLRQNWVDTQGYQAGLHSGHGVQHSAHSTRGSRSTQSQDLVEDFSQLTTQLSQEFMDFHQSSSRGSAAANSALRYAPQKARSGFNASAPAFQPQFDNARQVGKRLPPTHSQASYAEKDPYGMDTASGHFRPPQQTQYEPPLPNTNSIRVGGRQQGQHRQTRSDGSGDPRSSAERGAERAQRLSTSGEFTGGLRSGGNSLQSSIESDGGSLFNSPFTSEAKDNIHQITQEVIKQSSVRVDIPESYEAKMAYKIFSKEFKEKERVDIEEAKRYAAQALLRVPKDCRWRILLDLADLARKCNEIAEARKYYVEVCRAQPSANTGWLEWSKLEEETGDLRQALRIMNLGMQACSAKEMLLTKAIKLQERLRSFEEVRGMLSQLRHESMDKVWKSILEGSLFEARAGNIPVSRRLFKYLISHVPWYGPIYFEAFRLEEKEGEDQRALVIILKGLKELPRYGPLWFGLFRIMERLDIKEEHQQWQRGGQPKLANLSKEAAEAVRSISKELTWKVHFEKSQAEERAAEVAAVGMHQNSSLTLQQCRNALLGGARQSLVRSLMSCPANLRWRVLLVGARMELGVGAVETARFLLQRALQEVPGKSKSYVYLECSRVEEFLGNLDTARALLLQARLEVSREWKVYLEAVLVEARAGYVEKAAKVAREAVRQHSGTGRLWAMYIQLCHRLEVKYFNETEKVMIDCKLGNPIISEEAKKILEDIQNKKHAQSWLSKECVIRRAIAEVPKSGEVWCERARCQLNPLSVHCFSLSEAQQALSFATQFTPQYGDTFVEYVRLEMLCQVLLPRVLQALGIPVAAFIRDHVSADLESDLTDLPQSHWDDLPVQDPVDTIAAPTDQSQRERRKTTIMSIERMQYDAGNLIAQYRGVTIKNLNRRCVNADPNYGAAWFHCRAQPHDVPTTVLQCALDKLVHELTATQAIYTRAVFHFVRRCLRTSTASLRRTKSIGAEDGPAASPTRPRSADSLGRKRREIEGAGITRSLDLPPGALSDWANSSYLSTSADTSVICTPASSSVLTGGRRGSFSPSRDFAAATQEAARLGDELSPLSALLQCEAGVLEDIAAVDEQLAAWPKLAQVHLLPFVEIGGGALYCCTDFITGMMQMNRDMYNPNLPAEGRRKILFGSDQIVS